MPPKRRFITCEICENRASRSNHDKRMFMARFPLDEARCKQWVKFVGKEDLIYVPIEKLHTLKYVCGNHFDKRAFNKKRNRLKNWAIPSKNLKADPLPDEMLLEFPCHIYSNIDVNTSQRINDNEASLFQAGPSNSDSCTAGQQLLAQKSSDKKEIQSRKRKQSPSSDVAMHVFPNPDKFPERFKAWIDLLGGKVEIPVNEFLKKKRICDIHFISEHRNRNKRLNALAIPKLHLPGISKAQESENSDDTPFAAADTIASDSESEKDTPSNHAALSDATLPNAGSSGDHNIREPSPPPQLNLHTAQMCRVCLALDVKMFDLKDTELKIMFQSITGIKFEENKGSKLGSLICWECAARLKAAATFRSKALFSESLLQTLINKGEQIQKKYFETVKEQADGLVTPKILTATEVFHIVDIENQNNMTQLVQSGDDDHTPLTDNNEIEESIMEEINDENYEMDIAGDDNVAIITEIVADSVCPNTEKENMTKILEINPLHSTSTIEETIKPIKMQDIGHTLHQSDFQENCDDQIIKTYLESIKKSKKVPKKNKQIKRARSKRAEIHDQLNQLNPYYIKGDSEDGNKKKKLRTYGGSSKKSSIKERQEIHTSSGAVANTVAEKEI